MQLREYLSKISQIKPLIHHITNVVTINDCANVTLLTGALPVMANSPREAADMVSLSQALVLNIGTLHDEQVEAMLLAGAQANKLNIPIILDPVGAGATSYRTQTAQMLMQQLQLSVVKGNAGEIATLAGQDAEVRGVESGVVDNILSPARKLAKEVGCVVAVTGEEDLVVQEEEDFCITGGSERMKTFVGSGCVAASLIGCFVAVCPENPYGATLAALSFYRKAAEAAEILKPSGPLAFRDCVFMQIANLAQQEISG